MRTARVAEKELNAVRQFVGRQLFANPSVDFVRHQFWKWSRRRNHRWRGRPFGFEAHKRHSFEHLVPGRGTMNRRSSQEFWHIVPPAEEPYPAAEVRAGCALQDGVTIGRISRRDPTVNFSDYV